MFIGGWSFSEMPTNFTVEEGKTAFFSCIYVTEKPMPPVWGINTSSSDIEIHTNKTLPGGTVASLTVEVHNDNHSLTTASNLTLFNVKNNLHGATIQCIATGGSENLPSEPVFLIVNCKFILMQQHILQ